EVAGCVVVPKALLPVAGDPCAVCQNGDLLLAERPCEERGVQDAKGTQADDAGCLNGFHQSFLLFIKTGRRNAPPPLLLTRSEPATADRRAQTRPFHRRP
ncbi:30S ribosomal protein S6, partial [Dysosmobacter welbionis]